jgi:hypothetical protein
MMHINDLPSSLSMDMTTELYRPTLQAIELFQQVTDAFIGSLCRALRLSVYLPGAMLCSDVQATSGFDAKSWCWLVSDLNVRDSQIVQVNTSSKRGPYAPTYIYATKVRLLWWTPTG